MRRTKIDYDIWYPVYTIKDIAYIGNISFYPADSLYRGHLFNQNGYLIGDFTTSDGVALEKRFPGCFN